VPVGSTDGQEHPVSVELSEVADIGANRLSIGGMEAFHVKLRDGRNFNFATTGGRSRIVATIRHLIAH